MTTSIPSTTLEKFTTFGDLLRFLRRRMGITQMELAIAVGYSDTQISRLEQNLRLPDIPTIEARFVPALGLEEEPKVVGRLLDLAANIRREDAPALGLCPYKGLNYFDEADADLFVGREALTAKLAERIISLTSDRQRNEERFLAIVGASGSGKSSLVRAGVVSALRWNKFSTDWHIHVFTPTAHPLESLAATLIPESNSVSGIATLMDNLARESRSLQIFAKRRLRAKNGSRLLLVVDQFEELFALCRSEEERVCFIENLLTAASEPDGPVILLITLRADFYAHCAEYVQLREALAKQQEYIGAMNAEEMKRAIAEPAQRGRWEFEPGLVDLILHDVGHEPGALPLLSHALFETWQRRRGRMMTLSGYASSGGVRGAIAETAETVFNDQFTPEQREIARRVFLRLTELGDETVTSDTRRRATFRELILRPEEEMATHTVLKALADARLITTSEDSAEVAHEALIREWPTLRSWLEDNRESLRLHRHLTEAAQEWLEMNREPDLLYRGARLAQAREWAASHAEELNALEHEFLKASVEHSERELAEKEAQRQRELDLQRQRADEQTQAARQLRRRAVFLTGALMLAAMLAVTAFLFSQRANQQAQLSASRELAAAAISNLEVDPERSILLALQSMSVAHTLEAEDALHKAVQASRVQLTLSVHADWVNRAAFSPDGTRLATTSDDGTTRVSDALSGQELFTLSGHGGWVMGVAYSPDGTRLVTLGEGEAAKIWDANTGRELLTLVHGMPHAWGIAFSADGKKLAISGPATEAQVWDIALKQKALSLIGHTDGIWYIAFSPDGTHLATASWDETARVWDADTGEAIFTLTGHSGTVRGVAFSPDGRYLATASDDDTAKLWDLTTGTEILNLSDHTSSVFGVAFSPDGTRLITASLDQTVKVWQLSYSSDGNAVTGQELLTLSGHTDPITGLALSPDGNRLATASGDRTARVWDVSSESRKELLALSGPEAESNSIAFSPNGKRLATAGNDGTARVWDAATGQELHTLTGHTGPVGFVTYSPDGERIATASNDGTGRLWDADSGRPLITLSGHTGWVNGVAFSPDGERIATASEDKTAIIWDTNTGKQLAKLAPQLDEILVVTFSPDGTRLATAGRGGIPKVWDAATGQILLVLTSESYYTDQAWRIWSVAFSPDGTRLAAGSQDGLAKVWDASTGELLRTLAGHNGEVAIVSFSPDGSRIATSSRDGTAKIWDAATGQNLLTLEAGDGGGLTGVVFDPSGARLATSGDRGVRVFALRIEDLVALAWSRVTRSLTTEECQKYLHLEACLAEP